jgi:hypothetical protein
LTATIILFFFFYLLLAFLPAGLTPADNKGIEGPKKKKEEELGIIIIIVLVVFSFAAVSGLLKRRNVMRLYICGAVFAPIHRNEREGKHFP